MLRTLEKGIEGGKRKGKAKGGWIVADGSTASSTRPGCST
jgi:hypothetical protein